MAQATIRNFDVEQGTQWKFSFIVKDSGGSAIDLLADNAEVRMRIKTDYTFGGLTVLTASSTGTPNSYIAIHAAAVTGNVTVTIPPSETISNFTLGQELTTYVWDIEIESDSLDIQRLYKGEWNLYKELTTPDADFTP
jgi:hypothetical protein